MSLQGPENWSRKTSCALGNKMMLQMLIDFSKPIKVHIWVNILKMYTFSLLIVDKNLKNFKF